MKFHVDIELHVENHDADVMFLFPNIIKDRFDGTAIRIDEVKTTRVIEVESRDKKKDILEPIPGTCFLHSDAAGQIVYLVDDLCPLEHEHDSFLLKSPVTNEAMRSFWKREEETFKHID